MIRSKYMFLNNLGPIITFPFFLISIFFMAAWTSYDKIKIHVSKQPRSYHNFSFFFNFNILYSKSGPTMPKDLNATIPDFKVIMDSCSQSLIQIN